jgi:hypothetical protein
MVEGSRKYKFVARNLTERKWWALIIGAIFVFSGVATIAVFAGLGNAHGNALNGDIGLADRATSVYGYNGTTWKAASLVLSGDNLKVNFPEGFEAKHVVVFVKNPTYDVQGMLNTSYYYQNLSVLGVPTTANLATAYLVVGQIFNSTSVHSINDKAYTSVAINQTLFNNATGVSNLGNNQPIDLFDLFGTPLNDYAGYELNFAYGSSFTTSSFMNFTLNGHLSRPFSINLLEVVGAVEVAFGLLGVVLLINAIPRRR